MRWPLFPWIDDLLLPGIAQVGQLLSQFSDHAFQLHDLPSVVDDHFVQLFAQSLLVRQFDFELDVFWVHLPLEIFDRFTFGHYT